MNKDTVSYVLLRAAEAENVGWKCLLETGRNKRELNKDVRWHFEFEETGVVFIPARAA